MAINRRFRLPGASQGTPLPGAFQGPSPSQLRQQYPDVLRPPRGGESGFPAAAPFAPRFDPGPVPEMGGPLPQPPQIPGISPSGIFSTRGLPQPGTGYTRGPTGPAGVNLPIPQQPGGLPGAPMAPAAGEPLQWDTQYGTSDYPYRAFLEQTGRKRPQGMGRGLIMNEQGQLVSPDYGGAQRAENRAAYEAAGGAAAFPPTPEQLENWGANKPLLTGLPSQGDQLRPQPGPPQPLIFDPAAKVDPIYAEMNRQDLYSTESTRTFNSPEFKKWQRKTRSWPLAGGHSNNQAYLLAAYNLSGGAQAWQLTPEELASRNLKREMMGDTGGPLRGIGPFEGTPPGTPGPGMADAGVAPGPAAAGPIPPVPGVEGLPPTGQLTQQGMLPGGTTAVGGPAGVGSTQAANGAGGLFGLGGLGDIDPSSPQGLMLLQMAANRINQTTPSGRLEFTGPGRSESELTLSPEMQRIFDLEVDAAVAAKLQGTAAIGSLDYGADFGASRDAATRAAFARGQGLLDPVFELQEKRRRTALLNRGIVEGSEAFRTDIRENIFDPREKAYLALAQESIGAGLKEFATLEDARTARVNQAKGLLGLGGAEVPELRDFFAPSEIDVIGAETTAIARENARLTAAANASSVAAANTRADEARQAQMEAAKRGQITTLGAVGLAGILGAGGAGKAIVEGVGGLLGRDTFQPGTAPEYPYNPADPLGSAQSFLRSRDLPGAPAPPGALTQGDRFPVVPGPGIETEIPGSDAGGRTQLSAYQPDGVPVDGGVQDGTAAGQRQILFDAQGRPTGPVPTGVPSERAIGGADEGIPTPVQDILGKPLADDVAVIEAARDVPSERAIGGADTGIPSLPPSDFLPYGPEAAAGLEGIGDMTAIASDAAAFGDLAVTGSPISGGLATGSTGSFLGVPLDVNIAGTSIPTTAILAPLIGAFTGEKRGAEGAIEGAMKAGIPITIQLAAIAEATAASAAATAGATAAATASGASATVAAAAGAEAGAAAASQAAGAVMGPAAAVAIPLAVFKIYNSIKSAQKAKQEGKQVAERAKFSGTIQGAITGATGHGTTHSFMSSPEFKVLSGAIGPDQLGKKGTAFLSKYKEMVGGSDVTKMTDADVVNTAVTTGGVLAHIVELPGMQEKFDQWYSGKISQDQFNKSSRAALEQFGRKNESEILEAHLSMRIMTQTEWDDLYNPGD
jgi:hypothetical protein